MKHALPAVVSTNYRFANRSRDSNHVSHAVSKESVDLSGGYAYPKFLPDISDVASIAAIKHRTEVMQYSDVLGLDELRDLIVQYVIEDGIACDRENVMIVNGAKHGLDLACRVFIEPGDQVIVTNPTYMTAINILRSHQVKFLTIDQDEDGILVDDLEDKLRKALFNGESLPKLLFDVPDFHNPTGLTTSLVRRKKLISLAQEFGFVIVEDDPYRRIRFEGKAVPPIKSLDHNGVVITLGTASKILAPGLRIGWVIAAPEILSRMANHKADGGTSPFNQRVFTQLLTSGQIEKHITSIVNELRIHRDVMVDSLLKLLPDCKVRVPHGGYFLWLQLPPNICANALAGLAEKHGVKVYSGDMSFAGDPTENALRLCYSYEDPSRIKDGIQCLANAYDEIIIGNIDPKRMQSAVTAAMNTKTF